MMSLRLAGTLTLSHLCSPKTEFSSRERGRTGISLSADFVKVSGRSHTVTTHFCRNSWSLHISASVCVTLCPYVVSLYTSSHFFLLFVSLSLCLSSFCLCSSISICVCVLLKHPDVTFLGNLLWQPTFRQGTGLFLSSA